MAYDNSGRAERARQTRARVIAAAGASFVESGYAATTIRGIAQDAGVSPETVYKTFRNKATLLKAVYDVALAGDGEPIPMSERPEFQAGRLAADPVAAAVAYGQRAGWLSERIAPLLRVVVASRGADPELDAFAATTDAERLVGATMAVTHWAEHGWLKAGLTPERARDTVWMLISPAVFLLLDERGWSLAEYAQWLADALLGTVLTDIRPLTPGNQLGP